MFGAAALIWPVAPDSFPVHFSVNGEPTRYSSKVEGLLAIPLVSLGILVLLKLLPRIDPNRAQDEEFAYAYNWVILAIEVFMAGLYASILAAVFNLPLNITSAVLILVGILLVAVGVVLERLRPNWFVGIRTPWTLSSERSWVATHRVGRPVFIGMGVVLVLAGLIQSPWSFYVAVTICVLGALGLIVYSYVVWRQDPATPRP
jgi:uncharacterized membrane protein